MRLDIKKSAGIALMLTLAMLLVNGLMAHFLGGAAQTFYSTVSIPGVGSVNIPQTYNPVSDSIGNQITAWITGITPSWFPSVSVMLTLFLSSLVIVILGTFLVDLTGLTLKGKVGRLMTIILMGAVIPYLYFVGAVMPSFGMMGFFGLLIYTAVASWVTAIAADFFRVTI